MTTSKIDRMMLADYSAVFIREYQGFSPFARIRVYQSVGQRFLVKCVGDRIAIYSYAGAA